MVKISRLFWEYLSVLLNGALFAYLIVFTLKLENIQNICYRTCNSPLLVKGKFCEKHPGNSFFFSVLIVENVYKVIDKNKPRKNVKWFERLFTEIGVFFIVGAVD